MRLKLITSENYKYLSQKRQYVRFSTKSTALSNTSSFNTTQLRKGFLTKKGDISAKLIHGTEPKLYLQLVKVHIAEFVMNIGNSHGRKKRVALIQSQH
jgi:hypothetical protein